MFVSKIGVLRLREDEIRRECKEYEERSARAEAKTEKVNHACVSQLCVPQCHVVGQAIEEVARVAKQMSQERAHSMKVEAELMKLRRTAEQVRPRGLFLTVTQYVSSVDGVELTSAR